MDVPFGKKIRFPFVVNDKAGKPTNKVDGTPAINTTFGTVVETVKGAGVGEWSAKIDPGAPGSGSVSGTLDADLGDGVEEIGFTLGDFTALDSDKAASVAVGAPTIED